VADDASFCWGYTWLNLTRDLQRTSEHCDKSFQEEFARNTIKNTFRVMSAMFQMLRKPLILLPETADQVVMAVCHVHNYIISNESTNTQRQYSTRKIHKWGLVIYAAGQKKYLTTVCYLFVMLVVTTTQLQDGSSNSDTRFLVSGGAHSLLLFSTLRSNMCK
jgi:hypothetical protein